MDCWSGVAEDDGSGFASKEKIGGGIMANIVVLFQEGIVEASP